MLTGKRAFQKPTTPETMSAILNEDPAPISQMAPSTPLALQKVIHRGLEKNPEQRFQSASDLAFALDALGDTTLLSLPVQALTEKKSSHLRTATLGGGLAVVFGLGMIAYLWLRATPVPRVLNYVQLTHDGQQKTLIGSDGSRLYLTLVSSGAEDVTAVPTSGGEQTNIPMPSPSMVPVGISPDKSAFLIVQGQGVPPSGPFWSLPVLGGSPRRLGDAAGTDAEWSPDGKTLAYANGGALFLAKADGTEPRKLLTMKSQVSDLAWSPNGGVLRFGTSDFSQSGTAGTGVGQHLIWEVAADGSNPHQLLVNWHNAPDECCGAWTADGKYFVFQAQGQIWALPKENRFIRSAPQPIELTSSPMSLHSPIPSRDGKKLFVVGRTYRGELTRFDPKSGQPSPFLGGISAEWIAFPKDGKWAAYVSYPEGTLWRCKADGSERVQLTFPPLRPALPRWSPDGKTLVFFQFPQSSKVPARIFTIASEGGTPRELMPDDPLNQQDPSWSPDGSRIAFAGDSNDATVNKSGPAIRILDVQTRHVTTVPASQGLFSPRWSPDGQHLAAMTGDSSTLLVFDFRTQKWTQLGKGTFGWLNWTSDGKSIYILDFTGKGAVVRISVNDHKTDRMVDLKNFVATGQYGGTLSLAPDDSPLMLRDTGTQDVYALDWIEP